MIPGPWRNVLLVKVLRNTGKRIGEILSLTPSHLKTEGPNYYFTIQISKKKKPTWESVYLNPELGASLIEYIKGHNILAGDRIFPISKVMAWKICQYAGIKALGRPIHPHQFRHLYTKWLVEHGRPEGMNQDQGLPMDVVAKMVGHDSPETTRKIYWNLSSTERAAINRRIPV